jgi:hypothetical protein
LIPGILIFLSAFFFLLNRDMREAGLPDDKETERIEGIDPPSGAE